MKSNSTEQFIDSLIKLLSQESNSIIVNTNAVDKISLDIDNCIAKILSITTKELHDDTNHFVIDNKKQITINDIRGFATMFSNKSNVKRFGIIKNAHNMNLYASNALLKILEERNFGHIILITEKLSSFPATIISRCHILRVNNSTKKSSAYNKHIEILANQNNIIDICDIKNFDSFFTSVLLLLNRCYKKHLGISIDLTNSEELLFSNIIKNPIKIYEKISELYINYNIYHTNTKQTLILIKAYINHTLLLFPNILCQ